MKKPNPRPSAGRRIIHGITKRRASAEAPAPRADLMAIGRDAPAIVDRLRLLGAFDTVAVSSHEAADDARGRLVVMSPATYRALIERAEDAAAVSAYDRTRGEESVPAAIVERLMEGEHPVRVWRDHRGLTLEALGAKAKLSIAYLSEIEAGKKPGSIKALRAIATALKLDLDDLTSWLK